MHQRIQTNSITVRATTLVIIFLIGFFGRPAMGQSICEGEFRRPSYKSRGHYCVSGQVLKDAYEPGRALVCEEMEVDHLISLRHAWESGVCGEDLKRLANDPRNLKFTYWRTNREKGFSTPEEFAQTRSKKVSIRVLADAKELRRDYKIKTRDKTVEKRLLFYALQARDQKLVPLSAIRTSLLKKITYKKINGRNVAFVSRKAIGYSAAVGLTIEGLMVSGWAADWIMSPSRDARMKERAIVFSQILEGDNE